jgi:repressor LexA
MRENSLIKENILKYLDFKGVTKYEFYQKTGVSNGVLSQKNGFSEENLMRFLSYYTDINLSWLLTGQGSMLKAEEKEDRIIAERVESFSINLTNENLIPIMDIETVGGFGSANFSISQNNISDYCQIPAFKGKKVDFMIPVRGFSMYPRYKTGDLVACTIISENTFIQWNEVHVIATREQGILLKRLNKSEKEGYLKAISDNKDFPPIDIPESEITGIALVVGGVCVE